MGEIKSPMVEHAWARPDAERASGRALGYSAIDHNPFMVLNEFLNGLGTHLSPHHLIISDQWSA
ncbi:hypothetical protein PGT21_026145 [Puccinia graminis f. sp. tritici]|uniref:Uncharacterized protein n=1 Tax=Puccinia graminis f. sp. tritici TaxID=56615 RepID=A0A5B0NYH8_PUCGR|nr:hypothetical protein PGT21_026145 [Puccinia graminis f. sp. tritici]